MSVVSAGNPITIIVCWYDQTTGEMTQGVVRASVVATFELALRPGFRWGHGTLIIGDDHTCVSVDLAEDRFFEDEGQTWCCGWPPIDSEEVQALKAAFALGAHEGVGPSQLFDRDASEDYEVSDHYSDDACEARGLVR